MEENTTQLGPEVTKDIEERIIAMLQTIFDPEIPVNIYEMGLIYEIQVSPFGDVYVKMTLTSPNCPVAGSLPGEVEQKVREVPGVKSVELDLTFDPPWEMSRMSEAARLELGMF
jgi:FeS assembly SUF system protein